MERSASELARSGVEHPIVTECHDGLRDSRHETQRSARRTQYRHQPHLAPSATIDGDELRPPGDVTVNPCSHEPAFDDLDQQDVEAKPVRKGWSDRAAPALPLTQRGPVEVAEPWPPFLVALDTSDGRPHRGAVGVEAEATVRANIHCSTMSRRHQTTFPQT
jgi:hypothetical protein